jgi:serine/threonine protein kinase
MTTTTTQQVESVLGKVKSTEIRDEPTPASMLSAGQTLTWSYTQPNNALVNQCNRALLQLCTKFPETKVMCMGTIETCKLALARAAVANMPEEADAITVLVLNVYAKANAQTRVELLRLLCACLQPPFGPAVCLVKIALRVMRAVLAATTTTTNNRRWLIEAKLLPLHETAGKISPTQSLLGEFHQEVTMCLAEAAKNDVELMELALQGVLDRYPGLTEGNSPKEILFLHEIEHLVTCSTVLSAKTRQGVVNRLAACAGSLNGLVAERALTFWQQPGLVAKLQSTDGLLGRTCTMVLAKTFLEHWSPTVRTMAGAALLALNPSSDNAVVAQAVKTAQQLSKASESAPPPPSPLPKTFSSTTVIRDATEPFAMGSFGCLWRGRATVPGKGKAQWPLIALKEMDDKAMAQREAECMSRIGDHANLVALLGVFEMKTATCLVLDLIDGGDLHTCVCDRGSLSLDAARFIAGEIGAALRHVHSRGYVFGDVKPENVLLTKTSHVKLCDFGSCVGNASSASSTTVVKGTVEYLPPEQASSKPGDFWALGCVLHFMLTGRPPVFFAEDTDEDLDAAFKRAVTFSEERGGNLVQDASAKQVIAALTQRDPNQRPEDGGESMDFFRNARPWSELHRKAGPGLGAGAVPKQKGPWTRRTFSVIHAPMPERYGADAGDVALLEGMVDTTPIAASWRAGEDGGTTVLLLSKALPLEAIPKKRVLDESPRSEEGSVAPTKSAAARRQMMTTKGAYQVLGLDLTAG